MPRQVWWTGPFRTVKRDGRLYRLGSAEEGVAVPLAPRFAFIYAAGGTALVLWPLSWWLGLPVNVDTLTYWYLLVPALAGWSTRIKVRDGKRSHEWAAAMLAHQVARRFTAGVPGYHRVRRGAARHVIPTAWTPADDEETAAA